MEPDPVILVLEKCKSIFEKVLKPSKKETLSRTQFLSYVELPVDDTIFPDYREFIPNPVSLSQIREKLKIENASTKDFHVTYVSPVQFAIDFRRVIANFLRYNWNDKSLQLHKNEARKLLYSFEDAFEEVFPMMCTSHPYIIHVLNAIEKACKIPGSANKHLGAAYPIMHDINCYSSDGYPYKYLDYIKKPISVGQILGQIIERVAYANPLQPTATKKSKKNTRTPAATAGEVVITNLTVPYYYYGGDIVDEVLTDVDLLVSNIIKYGKAIDEDPDAVVLKDAKMVVSSLHSQLDEFAGIRVEPLVPLEPESSLSLSVPTTTSVSAATNKNRKSVSKSRLVNAMSTPATINSTAATTVSSGLKLTLGKKSTPNTAAIPTLTPIHPVTVKEEPNASTIPIIPTNAPAATSLTLELASSVIVSNVLKAIFMDAISLVKTHYMMAKAPPMSSAANFVPYKVSTALPFLKAVDPIQYPDYASIIWNPMNLNAIEKKIQSNKYTLNLQSYSQTGKHISVPYGFLDLDPASGNSNANLNTNTNCIISASIEAIWNIRKDVQLIRNNAHLYNTGINGLEVRLMSDALVDYFEYVLKQSLIQLSQGYLYPSIGVMLHNLVNIHNAGNISSSLSASNIENNPSKLIATFNAIYYTIAVDKGEVNGNGSINPYAYIVDKEKRSLVPTKVLSDWLCISPPDLKGSGNGITGSKSLIDTTATGKCVIPASVSEYLVHSAAERVEKEEVERVKAIQISKQKEQRIAASAASALSIANTNTVDEFAALGGDEGFFDSLTPVVSPIPVTSKGGSKTSKEKGKRKDTSVSVADVMSMEMESETYPYTVETQLSLPQPAPAAAPAPAPAPAAPLYETHVLNEWELTCIQILKRLKKHDFIDTSRDKCMSNYYVRMTSTDPIVSKRLVPVDLLELYDMINLGGSGDIPELKSPAEFYRKLIGSFSNAIILHERNDSNYAKKVTKRSKYLIKLCKYLCLEKLPLDAEIDGNTSVEEDDLDPMKLPFNIYIRDKYRQYRIVEYLEKYGPTFKDSKFSINDCRVLLKDMERLSCKTTKDRKVYSWFNVPVADVSDYSVYVREPMDISIIKEKLESYRYRTYDAFLYDFKLVFNNAITYNEVHMEKDVYGVSKEIYEKGVSCRDMLEELIHTSFSIDIADKWGKMEIQEEENMEIKLKQNAIEEKLMEEKREFFKEQQALLQQEDEAFAADLDRDKKREETKRKMKELQEFDDEEEEMNQMLIESKPPPRILITCSKELLPYTYFAKLHKKWLGDVGHSFDEMDEVVLNKNLPVHEPSIYFPVTQLLLPGSSINAIPPAPLPMGFPPPTPVYPTLGTNNMNNIDRNGMCSSSNSSSNNGKAICNSNINTNDNNKSIEVSESSHIVTAASSDNTDSTPLQGSLQQIVTMQHFPFSRTQELFLKYQVKRHKTRHRAWEIYMSRPGVIKRVVKKTKTNCDISNTNTDDSTDNQIEIAIQDIEKVNENHNHNLIEQNTSILMDIV